MRESERVKFEEQEGGKQRARLSGVDDKQSARSNAILSYALIVLKIDSQPKPPFEGQ